MTYDIFRETARYYMTVKDSPHFHIDSVKNGRCTVTNLDTKRVSEVAAGKLVERVGEVGIGIKNPSALRAIYGTDEGIKKYNAKWDKDAELARALISCQSEAYENLGLNSLPMTDKGQKKLYNEIKRLIIEKGLLGKMTKDAIEIVENENAHASIRVYKALAS